MTTPYSLPLVRRLRLSMLATIAAMCLLLTTTLGALADTGSVGISDPVGVLNRNQVVSEGAKLPDPLNIYTTNTFSGSAASFVQRTIAAHLTSKRLIVIAIDTAHRFLAIVNGSSVPLSKTQDSSAGTAFKNSFHNGDFTGATIAAIKSLESSLGVGSKGGFFSGLVIVIIVAGLVILAIISAIVGFFRRLLGFAPRSSPSPAPTYQEAQPQQAYNRGDYGDGRDNFGSGAAGDF